MYTSRVYCVIRPFCSQTGGCPDGYYCPMGTGHPLSFPCEPGFFRNESYRHDGGTCAKCPARHYCGNVATHTPSVCPEVTASRALFQSQCKCVKCIRMKRSLCFISGLLLSWGELCPRAMWGGHVQLSASFAWSIRVHPLWWGQVLHWSRQDRTFRRLWGRILLRTKIYQCSKKPFDDCFV